MSDLLKKYILEDDIDGIKAFLDKGFDVSEKLDEDGVTPLLYATAKAVHTNYNVLEVLLENGANPNPPTADNVFPPLSVLASQGLVKHMELLLEYKADINAASSLGKTALFSAVESIQPQAVSYLLERGANTTNYIDHNHSLLTIIPESFTATEILLLKELEQNYIGFNLYQVYNLQPFSTIEDKVKIMELIINQGLDINHQIKNGWTALMFSCTRINHLPLTKVLLEHGADISIRDKEGHNPLSLAIKSQNYPAIELLKQYGAK